MELKKIIEQKAKNFYINKEKRVVTCVLTVDINEYQFKRVSDFRKLIKKYNFHCNHDGYYEFVSRSKCCPNDEFNEQLGKDLAYFKAKQNLLERFSRIYRAYHRQSEDEYYKVSNQISDSIYKIHKKYADICPKVKPIK